MSGQSSTIFTIGTMLSRAESAGITVRVLVEGQWLTGRPLVSDGHGVLLDGEDGQFLVRMEAISAVGYPKPRDDVPTPRPGTSVATV